ncbi:hypothetical protein Pmani_014379 [Petrolisthes manimaculis]|uniref:Pentatricopeptide repeat-containing protein n=1 Tax=Petrolisthes manimaculis TaxID=1843537 RepID=A0AAE1PSZ3_9EUCA|nr:hypothetical protein Pmani_014379 [Petrolisthes manimaculis]
MSWRRLPWLNIKRINGSLRFCGVNQCNKQLDINSSCCMNHKYSRCSSRSLHLCKNVSQSSSGSERVSSSEHETTGTDDDKLLEFVVNGQQLQGALWIMLLLHASQNDFNTVLALLKKAKAEGLEPSVRVMRDVVRAFIKNKNVDAVLYFHSTRGQPEQLSHTSTADTTVNLCTLLVEGGRGLVALKILKEFLSLGCQEVREEELKKIKADCRKLLDIAADKCDFNLTRELFEEMMGAGWIQPENFTVVPLLQCKMNSGDLAGVVDVAEQIFQDYKLLPKRMQVLIALLKDYTDRGLDVSVLTCINTVGDGSNNNDPISRLVSLITSCYGDVQARHDLFFACLESGQPTAAGQVLQNLGKEIDCAQVVKMCGLYGKAGREDALLHLLSIYQPGHASFASIRCNMYSALLNVYVTRGGEEGGSKALDLYRAMLSENLTPSPAFLTSLTHLLDAVGIELPPTLTSHT